MLNNKTFLWIPVILSLFAPTWSADAFAGRIQKEDLKLTGQVRWSYLGSEEDFPQFFKNAGELEIIPDNPPALEEQKNDETPREKHNQDPEFLEKIREATMPNRIQRPVFRLP